eukprot:gene9853-10864_t
MDNDMKARENPDRGESSTRNRKMSVSFFHQIFNNKPFVVAEDITTESNETTSQGSPRIRSYSSALNARKNDSENGSSSLIMKSRNRSLTEALLGKRNTYSISSIYLNPDSSENEFSSSSNESLAGSSAFLDDAVDLKKPDSNMKENMAHAENFNFDKFAPNLVSESVMDETISPNDLQVKQKPMIDIFFDRVNSFSWIPEKMRKSKVEVDELEKLQARRKISGAYTDDLLLDRIYKNLDKNKMKLILHYLGAFALIYLSSSVHGYEQQSKNDNSYNALREILSEYVHDEERPFNKRSEEMLPEKDTGTQQSIYMPGVSPQKHDSYICYAQKVPRDEFYVAFKPKAEMQTAHHLLLFGCDVPFTKSKKWNCGEMFPVCKSGRQYILYAWGKNAPALVLPKGVGFKVGPSTPIKYIVLQVHYGNVDKFVGTNLKDYSGVIMDTTTENLRYHAGIYVLAEGYAGIPPHKPVWHLDTGCPYQGEAVLYPFAARVHAHKLAVVISGYKVRNGKWTLIHKENPQRPQAFYPVDGRMTIKPGDHLEARCTYNTMKKDVVTRIGATMKDEMCNFYIMFYYDSKKYTTEPPGMCNWGGLDDNIKFPAGSDKLDTKSQTTENVHGKSTTHVKAQEATNWHNIPKWSAGKKFGQISGLAVDNKGFLVVFHRAGRTWNANTFNEDNTLKGNPMPIAEDTLAWLNQDTGKVILEWGKGMFYLPHGLTVDHADNIWLTDVGSHQVFKFDFRKSKKPLLSLGKKGKPGSDDSSFCKPTDVAVDRTGVFYVSDGYCNHRILVFSPKAQLLMKISDKALKTNTRLLSSPYSFNIPHSVSLDEKNQELYVADRENGRVLVFSALFGNLRHSIEGIFGKTVYAVSYKDGYLHVISGPPSAKGFTYNVKTKQVVTWGMFNRPHDLAVSSNGKTIYVGEIGPNKLWKFDQKRRPDTMYSSKSTGNANMKGNNRLSSLLDQLDKVSLTTNKSGKLDEKEIEQIRYIANKMQQLLSLQEKCRKEILTKQPAGLIKLFHTLSVVSACDLQGALHIISCLNELLTSGKRIGTLIDHDLPEILFKSLITVVSKDNSKETGLAEEVITLLHSVLSKMGSKEKRFSIQARMTGALQVSLNVTKQNPQNFKVLHPVLQVLKIYANSSVNCNIMVKGAAIETLLKILSFCGQKRISSAKLILEILALLTKSKIGARRAVVHGGVALLLNMFVDWHRIDHRHRQTALRKSILTVLKLIVMINSGRKALINIDGTKILYNIGLEGLESKELDGIIKLIILILRKCFAVPKLPVKSICSIFSDQSKPDDDQVNIETFDDEAEETAGSSEEYSLAENESEDAEVNIDEANEKGEETETADQEIPINEQVNRSSSMQNFQEYKHFFQELSEFSVDLSRCSLTSEESLNDDHMTNHQSPSIRIPTAAMENTNSSFILPDESPSNHESTTINHDSSFPLIRKSSSLDHCSLTSKSKQGIQLITLSSDSQNEANMQETTTSLICMSNRSNQQRWYDSPTTNQHRTPSMPCIPVVHGNITDQPIDLAIKGLRFNTSSSSSPALNMFMKHAPQPDDQIPELILQEHTMTSKCLKNSGYVEMTTRLDKQEQSCVDGKLELNCIEHVLPFVKRAAPDLYGHYPMAQPEPLLEKKAWLHRHMIFQDFARYLNPDKVINRVAYDLDDLINNQPDQPNQVDATKNEAVTNELFMSPKKSKLLQNRSSDSLSNLSDEILKTPALNFESRFESGNLRKAIQIRQLEYDLILNPDRNTDRHCQWFYFEVSNMQADVPYRFNIINCEKFNSQFNFGMQPVFYSTKDSTNGRAGWERSGSSICYYKNCYQKKSNGVLVNRFYYTATFTIRFPYANDTCYLAYHFPFTFTMMMDHLNKMESRMRPDVYYNRQLLCRTFLGNRCELLTITEKPKDDPPSIIAFRKRPYIVLTSRVHPGESCASWTMKGVLDFLTSGDEVAVKLRESYIFKIVPFLNPDGVINGSHRCCMSGDDLNRQWLSPDSIKHPTIYHIKGLLSYLNKINKTPLIFGDFHGHSRKKNVFMYGCSLSATNASKIQGNTDALTFEDSESMDTASSVNDDLSSNCSDENNAYKTLPRILNTIAPAFAIQNCNFVMEKSKESTARIVVYKEFGVLRSYTVESTYCGADQGPYKGNHFGTRELEEMGKDFAVGLFKLSLSYSVKLHPEYFKEPSEYENSVADDSLSSTTNSSLTKEVSPEASFVSSTEDTNSNKQI